LIPAVLASCCIPGVYIAQEIDGMLLVDGGLTENVPLSALKKFGAHLSIAVNLNGNEGYTAPRGIVDVLSNAMDIAIDAQTRIQLREAHILISMDLTRFSRTSSEHFDQLLAIGFEVSQSVIGSKFALKVWFLFIKVYRFFRDLLPVKIPAMFQGLLSPKDA
jgi:NTE family protein